MSIDVIVVNYRTPDDLQGFMDSYDKYSGRISSTCYIVNVDPTEQDDKLAHYFVESALNPVVYVKHEENVGYARAVNSAAKLGTAPIIAIFNADVRFTERSLDEMYQAFIVNGSWGIAGPRQIDDRGRITHAGIIGTLKNPKHRGWREPNSEKFGDIREVVSVSGSAYFIRRKIWDELTACPLYREFCPEAEGAFLPTPHYYEETFCSYHAQAHEHLVMYYGPVTMVHRWHKASPLGGQAEKLMPESRKLFRAACDHHGIPHD